MATDEITDVTSETPAGSDATTELGIYFVLHVPKNGADTNDSPGERPVDNSPSFVKIAVNVRCEEAGQLHQMLRGCIGVIVESKTSDGQPQITPLACSA